MAKSFTINTPKYQKAQKEFYAYNVTNDESVLNTSNIKSTTFNFHFTNKNMTPIDNLSGEDGKQTYRLDDENTATLMSLQDFYTSNYDKIIDMSAKGNYVANNNTSDIQTALANNIFSKDINAYTFNMSDTNDSINAFILTINAAAKAVPMFFTTSAGSLSTLMDNFTFVVLPAYIVDSSEEDISKLACVFVVYGIPYFTISDDASDTGAAVSDISVTIYYKGDDE